jgi:tetratricopeptide (TPR) repeat protein
VRAQRALAATGPLDPVWWAAVIPPSYRERAEGVLRPAQPSVGAVRNANGSPAAWVTSLRLIYEFQFSDFAVAMGVELAERGRYAEARRYAEATLIMAPEHAQACVLYAVCSERMGEWDAARSVTERSLGAIAAMGETSPTLRLQYAEILEHLGDGESARRELEAMAALGGEIGAEARRRLEGLR